MTKSTCKWYTEKRMKLFLRAMNKHHSDMGEVYSYVASKLGIKKDSVERAWHRGIKKLYRKYVPGQKSLIVLIGTEYGKTKKATINV